MLHKTYKRVRKNVFATPPETRTNHKI
jgi:hypothetical protein